MNTNSNTIDTNLIRQVAFILIILFLGIVLFRELFYFFSAFLGAVTFYVLMRDRMFYLTERKGWKPTTTAWVLMSLSFFVILLPIGILGNILYSKISYVVTHSSEVLNNLKKMVEVISDNIGYDIIKSQNINELGPKITAMLPRALGGALNTLALITTMYFILYFMLVNGRRMEEGLYEYIPLKDGNVELISKEVKTMVVTNTIAFPLIALIQGVVGLIGYLIIGISEPFVWFVATCITALIPVIGAAIVYVPLSVMLFVQGDIYRGVAMTIWGFIFIGLVDNLLRFVINKKIGNIHPLVTIFGVIVGIQLFGFIGLIFGPLLISMFILLLKIYGNEFLQKRREMKRIK